MDEYKRNASKPPNGRPTIGFLCEHLVDEYSASMWAGVRDAAWELGANLICFSGGMLHDPGGFKSQANMLYDLVDTENVDGLVLWGAQLIHHTTLEELNRFCGRYRPLPIVNIGLALEGIPSLLVDNYQGMRDSVTHLIEVHGLQRIAYLCGPGDNPEVQGRYRGYTDALAEHSIPLDPSLVVLGSELLDESWRKSLESGVVGVRILLDERKLKPQVDFEALVGHDDGTCSGASRELQGRGIRVPADVAVASFDDIKYARYLMPPLTTVQQSFYDMGWRGTEMLLAQWRGEKVPERTILPMKMVIRQSCGCVDSAVAVAGVVGDRPDRAANRKKPQDVLIGEREKVIAEMVRGLGGSKEASRWANQVLDSFVAALATEVQGESPDIFLQALDDVLHQMSPSHTLQSSRSGQDVAAWHGALSALRRHLLSTLDDAALLRAESLWQQARVLVGETARRMEGYQALQADRQTLALREVGQALLTTFDLGGLMDVLAAGLPRLGIPSAYLSLYQDPQPYAYPQPAPEWSHLMLAQDRSGRVELEPDGQRFRSRQLMPEGLWPQERQYSFVVVPLYFREQQIGFSLFEVGPREGIVYDVLRGDISSALQGALLLQAREQAEKALERAYAEVEQQVAERTAELQQEIFERRRAEKELKRYRDRLEELVVERTQELEKAQAELVRQERLSALGQLTATV
ncbi:MAG: substrate-binding domain-containing protein, partial [Anaerolineae bacterium]|nr:substrate-binding domain-containing protein [Anaerolineae bacterium]